MAEIEKKHHVNMAWDRAMAQVHGEMLRRQVHPSRTVVLVPYAQLMQEARRAWLRVQSTSVTEGGSLPVLAAQFLPRFETTMNWTRSLGGFESSGDDMRQDAARDVLTADSLLGRAGLEAQQGVLGGRLMEAAWSLARVAAAVPPQDRAAWGAELGDTLVTGMESPVLAMEVATGRLALAWAANSSYPSDPVFAASPDLLAVIEGFQSEPLAMALKQSLGERVITVALNTAVHQDDDPTNLALHATADAEDEAHCAAACVLAHLAAGRSPVALVAQDRVLTRRVRAMLAERGVAVRDETGWKLSTTRAAASLMSLMRAQVWDASADAVLDWLKNAPAFAPSQVTQSEARWRKLGVRDWRGVPSDDAMLAQVKPLREALQTARPLMRWLADLRATLQNAGQWSALEGDAAGQAVLDVLRLRDGAEAEFAEVNVRMSQSEFSSWVSQTLEGASYLPKHPTQAPQGQVVILPLSQLLGRPLAAVVLPGCDEIRLPVSPEPPGMWTPDQRVLLGLPSREQLAAANRAAWHYALQFPYVDLLWRQSEGGEHLMASGFVQELRLQQAPALVADPSVPRSVSPQRSAMPAPHGDALPLTKLSSTAYEDLRRCPYRFFALRQLKLQESDELESELSKRDFGNWLHLVLKLFHEASNPAVSHDLTARVAMINVAAELATQELALSKSEFLPFAAAWPRVRDGYLQWLTGHEASGATFGEAEAWKEMPLGSLTLIGKLDRIDRLADGSAMVMDYKTEAPGMTAQRIKASLEDTQLPFYAALLSDDTLAAAYINVGEKDATKTYAQPDIVTLRDHLIEGIATDMARIAAAEPMPALGEGKACDFCAARGLCRKDFWELG
jgi:ATP-dependent helicase/nuclease subunit B